MLMLEAVPRVTRALVTELASDLSLFLGYSPQNAG
jgi:hypothetical protein